MRGNNRKHTYKYAVYPPNMFFMCFGTFQKKKNLNIFFLGLAANIFFAHGAIQGLPIRGEIMAKSWLNQGGGVGDH